MSKYDWWLATYTAAAPGAGVGDQTTALMPMTRMRLPGTGKEPNRASQTRGRRAVPVGPSRPGIRASESRTRCPGRPNLKGTRGRRAGRAARLGPVSGALGSPDWAPGPPRSRAAVRELTGLTAGLVMVPRRCQRRGSSSPAQLGRLTWTSGLAGRRP